MANIGIIVEYNPLHNGHIYHLNKIKELANPDIIVAVCSSTFTMRGDLSVYDKFIKAKQALNAGIDLVIELPAVCAVQNADIFAYNSVKTLAMAKVDEIWIGSEKNDPSLYEKYLDLEANEDFITILKANLKNGLSYKLSYNKALEGMNLPTLDANDTLGVCYLKAIKKINPKIKLKTIQRIGDNEDTNIILSSYPSATAIRENFDYKYVPSFTHFDYENKFLNIDDLYPYFQYKMLTVDINDFFFNEEGIGNYLKKHINEENYHKFIEATTSKRYSKSRIKRFIFYILFGITKNEMQKLSYDFIRILAANQKGIAYLNLIKKDITIYTNVKEGLNKIIDFELRITKLLDLIYQKNLLSLEQKVIIK